MPVTCVKIKPKEGEERRTPGSSRMCVSLAELPAPALPSSAALCLPVKPSAAPEPLCLPLNSSAHPRTPVPIPQPPWPL